MGCFADGFSVDDACAFELLFDVEGGECREAAGEEVLEHAEFGCEGSVGGAVGVGDEVGELVQDLVPVEVGRECSVLHD